MAVPKNKFATEYKIDFILGYTRKSRQDEEREKRTGEDVMHEQRVLMDRVLSTYGVPYDIKEEVGSGDKISTRPVFQAVVEVLRNKKYGDNVAIGVKEISRLGRGSYSDMGLIYDMLRENRIYVVTPYRIYDPNNPADSRQIRFELFMSREEFETIRERLTGGRYNAAIEGKWVAGAAPFGYDYNPQTKRLEVNEDQARVVRVIFDIYVNGIDVGGERRDVSFRAMATHLKRIHIKTIKGGNEWRPTQVRQVLENDRYSGTIRFRCTERTADGKQVARPEDEHIIVENAHEAIIDIETWELAQDKLNGRKDKPRTKLDFSPCELAGLCVCKVCGRKMVRQYSVQHYKKADGETSVYHKEFLWCTTAACTFVKYRNVEEDLLQVLKYFHDLEEGVLHDQLSAITTSQPTERQSTNDMAKHFEQRKEELGRRLKFVYDKYESGVYSDQMFIDRKAEIDKEYQELESIKVEVEPEARQSINTNVVRKNISSILEAYENNPNKSVRNQILRSVFDHVVVEVIDKGRGRKQARHTIEPHLKFNLTRSEFLVL